MIEYAFLATGVLATGACGYFALPAGRGVHRLVMTRRQLRAELARSDRANDELTCALTMVSGERDAAVRTAWAYRHAGEKAADRIAEQEDRLREMSRVRALNAALEAQLANATAVSQKATAGSEDATAPRGIPVVHGAPYASTGPVPSRT